MDITQMDVRINFSYKSDKGLLTPLTNPVGLKILESFDPERIIWLYMTGDLPEKVAFVDGNTYNLKFSNLSIAPAMVNPVGDTLILNLGKDHITLNLNNLTLTNVQDGVVTYKKTYASKTEMSTALTSMCDSARRILDSD